MRTPTAPMRQRRQIPLGPDDSRMPTGRRQGLSRLEVDIAFREQDGRCRLCRRPLDPASMVVDHDHELARAHGHDPEKGCRACFRGLLDRRCNALLGWGFEDPEFFRRAAGYLAHRRGRA